MKKYYLFFIMSILFAFFPTIANGEIKSITEIEKIDVWDEYIKSENGREIHIQIPINIPDVDTLPIVDISRMEPDINGLNQILSNGAELSYNDLSGISIGCSDENSIYNIKKSGVRSYLCINDLWSYENKNDISSIYANDNTYSLMYVKEKMIEFFQNMYQCEDEVEVQKVKMEICYLLTDEKEIENGELIGSGQYMLTGNQKIEKIPIIVSALRGYKVDKIENRVEDELRMLDNTVLLYWRDEHEFAFMTRGAVKEQNKIKENMKICDMSVIFDSIRNYITKGVIEDIYSLELGYVVYAKSDENYEKKDKGVEFRLIPTWVAKCKYPNKNANDVEFSNAYDYMNEFGFQYLLINAQDGKISDPYTSGKNKYFAPEIIE